MRRFRVLTGLMLIAVGCATQRDGELVADDPSAGAASMGGKASAGNTGKGGSANNGGKPSTGGKTSSAGDTGSDAGSPDPGDGGDTGQGGEGGSSSGSGGGGKAGAGGKGGSGGKGGAGGSGGASGCTPTTAGPIQGLSARYESEIDTNGTSIGAQLVIFNVGPSTLNLADLKLRYYLTNEAAQGVNTLVNWAFIRPNPGGGEVAIKDKVTFSIVDCTAPNAYFEFTFSATAGNLDPGYHMRLSFTANNDHNETFNQSNDYSFDAGQASSADYSKVVIIQNSGTRAWGSEP